jgi:hypothetical protein
VTFTFVVNNPSPVDSVMINNLTDNIYGDLNGKGNCSVPRMIAAGGSYRLVYCFACLLLLSVEMPVIVRRML